MPGMMKKSDKPMSYKKGGMVEKPKAGMKAAAKPMAKPMQKPMSYMKGGMVKGKK